MLNVDKINVVRGKVQVLWDVSLEVTGNEIVVLVGSNGAGKSTLLETVMGGHALKSGTIGFLGEKINGLSTNSIVERGICYVPEGKRIFYTMSVLENLEMGAFIGRARKRIQDSLAWVLRAFPPLQPRLHDRAGKLSGGMQQMLAIGRGLMSRPTMLMLDEPSLGLAPILVETVFGTIKQINDEGITVVLIEQNAEQALELARRGYVLETGRIVAHGQVDELLKDARIQKSYLGM